MILPVSDMGDRKLNACLLILSPVDFESFIESLLSQSSQSNPDQMVVMQHLHAENLKLWASAEQVADFLASPEKVKKLAKAVSSAVCTAGFHSSNQNRDGEDPPYVWPCAGCSTPLIAGGHTHDGDPPPVKMSQTWGTLHHLVHRSITLMETVLSILKWREECLVTGQGLLVEELLMVPRDGRPLSEHTMEAISRGVKFEETGFLLGNLIGVIDNCLSVAPKAAYLAVALVGLLMSQKPALCVETLDYKPLIFALYKFLAVLSKSLMNPECTVDCWFAVSFLLNSLPIFYHLGDWNEVTARGGLKGALLPSSIGTLAINILHTAMRDGGNFDRPLPYDEYPELRRINLSVENVFVDAGEKVVEALRNNPLLFTAVALFEVLGRWQWRNLDVMSMRIPCRPSKEVARRLTPQQIRDFSESIAETFQEYETKLKGVIVKGKPSEIFFYILPIFEALAHGDRPSLPPSILGNSLLRASFSYSSQCCSLPGCTMRRKRGEGDEPLMLCSGGCKGLARYCCEEHQKLDWKKGHRPFCKRQS